MTAILTWEAMDEDNKMVLTKVDPATTIQHASSQFEQAKAQMRILAANVNLNHETVTEVDNGQRKGNWLDNGQCYHWQIKVGEVVVAEVVAHVS